MIAATRFKFLPIGSILDRYIVVAFVRIFAVSLVWVTILFAVVEFFDRVGTFVESSASVWTIARYFLFKIPLSMSRVIGFVSLFSTLFCLGMLARTQQITAMRASGLSLHRLSLPLLMVSFLICLLSFFWNEWLVPIFTQRAQAIYKTEVKGKKPQTLFGTQDIWIRGEGGFVNIARFDPKNSTLYGVAIFVINRDFTLKSVIQAPKGDWVNGHWMGEGVTEWSFLPDGTHLQQPVLIALPISETPDDLKLLARGADEFSFFELQRQISEMKAKGIDATNYEVDVQAKVAIPFVSPLMVVIGIPFALRRRASGGMAFSFAVAMLIAFAYWVLSAFCFSLGHSGALQPWQAAWIPSVIFALIGAFYFSAEE